MFGGSERRMRRRIDPKSPPRRIVGAAASLERGIGALEKADQVSIDGDAPGAVQVAEMQRRVAHHLPQSGAIQDVHAKAGPVARAGAVPEHDFVPGPG